MHGRVNIPRRRRGSTLPTGPAGSIRAEIYGKGGAGSDRRCLVLWPAQEIGAVRDDAGVLEKPDVGEHPLTTTSAQEGLSVN